MQHVITEYRPTNFKYRTVTWNDEVSDRPQPWVAATLSDLGHEIYSGYPFAAVGTVRLV